MTKILDHTAKHIILALDLSSRQALKNTLSKFKGSIYYYKIGMQLYYALGKTAIKEVAKYGEIFLDLKLHDIPNTVKGGLQSVLTPEIKMITLHTSGGEEMLASAREFVIKQKLKTKLIGVTVLTSIDDNYFAKVYNKKITASGTVKKLALISKNYVDGFVCSAQEVGTLRKVLNKDKILITPGIRLTAETQDQKRVATPYYAVKNGANFLVIGRPLLQAENIEQTLAEINLQIKKGLKDAN